MQPSSDNARKGNSPADPEKSQSTTSTYPVYLTTNSRKSYNILKFSNLVDFSQWKDVTASRDLTMKKVMEYQRPDDGGPEFGAGSEFGKKARDEAWKRRRGMNMNRKFAVKDMPIKFKVGQNKRYVGKKEGGVDQHSSYFIMSMNAGAPSQAGTASNGSFQLIPVSAWFGATTVANYKTLDDEEAEEEFSRRDKILNHFNLMLQKRLKDEQAEDGEDQNTAISKLNPADMSLNSMVQASISSAGGSNPLLKGLAAGDKSGSKVYYKNVLKSGAAALKISDYDDDFMSSSGEDGEDDDLDEDDESGGKRKKKKGSKKDSEDPADQKPKVVGGKKKKKEGGGEDAEGEEIEEESDDGDEEGLEYDYNEAESSPSEDESEDENETVADDKKAVPVEMDNVIEGQSDLMEQEEEEERKRREEEERKRRQEEQENSSKNGNKDDGGKGGKKGKKGGSPNDSSDGDEDDSSDEDPDNVTSVLFMASSKLGSKDKKDSSNDKNGDSKGGASSSGSLTDKQMKTAQVLSTAKVEVTSSGKLHYVVLL